MGQLGARNMAACKRTSKITDASDGSEPLWYEARLRTMPQKRSPVILLKCCGGESVR
jgi:hypothetical protein